MLTTLATRYWILLVVSEDEVSHSLIMNNHGFFRFPVRFVSPLPSEISLDVTSFFIWVSSQIFFLELRLHSPLGLWRP